MSRHIKQKVSLLKSVSFALQGIGHAFYSQRNLKIHTLGLLIVIAMGLFFQISIIEWVSLIIICSIIICLEMINTALELVVDLSTKEKKIRAKLCKDTAAGAVLLACIMATVCGSLIFYKRLVNLITGGL